MGDVSIGGTKWLVGWTGCLIKKNSCADGVQFVQGDKAGGGILHCTVRKIPPDIQAGLVEKPRAMSAPGSNLVQPLKPEVPCSSRP